MAAQRDNAPPADILDSPIDSQFPSRRRHWLRNLEESEGALANFDSRYTGPASGVSISAASVHDRNPADDAVPYSKEKYPLLNTLVVDSSYVVKCAQRIN